MKIARVFPSKTRMCPTDNDAYFGDPGLFTPQYDEIHVSVTFTWDIPKAERLARAWANHGKVKIGGVAINGESDQPFQSGIYLREGVTITSRGCPNNCPFCMVKKNSLSSMSFPKGILSKTTTFFPVQTGIENLCGVC